MNDGNPPNVLTRRSAVDDRAEFHSRQQRARSKRGFGEDDRLPTNGGDAVLVQHLDPSGRYCDENQKWTNAEREPEQRMPYVRSAARPFSSVHDRAVGSPCRVGGPCGAGVFPNRRSRSLWDPAQLGRNRRRGRPGQPNSSVVSWRGFVALLYAFTTFFFAPFTFAVALRLSTTNLAFFTIMS